MSLVHEQAAFLGDVAKLVAKATDLSFLVTGGELERSSETQAQLVKLGIESTMDSLHLRRCAIDLHFFRDAPGTPEWVASGKELEEVGSFWESLDPRNRWGGRSAEPAGFRHFERSLGAWPSSQTSLLHFAGSEFDSVAVPPNGDRPEAVKTHAESGALPVLKRGSSARGDVLKLQDLLVALKRLEKSTGEFDAKTESVIVAFQKEKSLVADGVVGPKTWNLLQTALQAPATPAASLWLGDADIEAAAAELGVDPDTVRAVYKVESNGHGFVDGQPRTLFEGHVFWERLKEHGVNPLSVQKGNEDILYPKWTSKFYGKNNAQERDRLRRAEAIHSEAALESASWGLFQIMGYHWKDLGAGSPRLYESVNDFVDKMRRHERDQLAAFCRFVSLTRSKGKPLVEYLKTKDWAAFAYGYNGPGYRKNLYDDKLREAYRKAAASR